MCPAHGNRKAPLRVHAEGATRLIACPAVQSDGTPMTLGQALQDALLQDTACLERLEVGRCVMMIKIYGRWC